MTGNPVNTIQFQIPDLPYSAVTIPIDGNFDAALSQIFAFRDAYFAWLNAPQDAAGIAEQERSDEPPLPPEPPELRPQQTRGGNGTASPQPRAGGPRKAGNPYGVTLYCPKHPNEELIPSTLNKDMDEVEIDGVMKAIPASWWHTGPDKKSCSTYQSKAIWGRVSDPVQAR
jgi:hypothetical protein